MSFLQKNIQSVSCLQRYEDEEHMKLYEQCGFPSLKHLFAVKSQTKYNLPLRVFRYFPSTEMTSPIPTTINPQMRLIRPPAAKLSSADSMSIGSTPKDSESPRTNPQRSKLPEFHHIGRWTQSSTPWSQKWTQAHFGSQTGRVDDMQRPQRMNFRWSPRVSVFLISLLTVSFCFILLHSYRFFTVFQVQRCAWPELLRTHGLRSPSGPR